MEKYVGNDFYKDTFIRYFMPELDKADLFWDINDNSVIAYVSAEMCNEWYAIHPGYDDDGDPVESFEVWDYNYSLTEDYDDLMSYLKDHGYKARLVCGNPDIMYEGYDRGVYAIVKDDAEFEEFMKWWEF